MDGQEDNSRRPPIDTGLDWIVRIAIWLATAMAFVVLVLILVNAITRSFAGFVVPGAFQMGQIAMPVIVFLALPWTFFLRNNYQLDLLYALLPEKGQSILRVLHSLIYTAIFGIWSYATILRAVDSVAIREYTAGQVRVPIYLARSAIAVGCSLILVVVAYELVRSVRRIGARTGPDLRVGAADV